MNPAHDTEHPPGCVRPNEPKPCFEQPLTKAIEVYQQEIKEEPKIVLDK